MIRSVDNPKTKSPINWEDIHTSANAIKLHIAVIRNLSKWQRASQFADKILFRWHWTIRSFFGSSVSVITVLKTDWKSLWIQKRHLVIFTFNQCKMMMTGAKLHHVKWIPVRYQTETDSRIITFILSRHCKIKIRMEKIAPFTNHYRNRYWVSNRYRFE